MIISRILHKLLLATFTVVAFAGCQSPAPTEAVEEKPTVKNIILLIGDGMGLSQVSSRFYNGEGEPNFKRFKEISLIQTSPIGMKITDSAAGATAFSAGKKTYNGAIAVDKDTTAIKTILEIAAEKSHKTGVISTSSITHATPASFYAHVKRRGMQDEIAKQLVGAPVDFFAGGGIRFFTRRDDGTDQLTALTDNGYLVDTTALNKPAQWDINQKYGYLLADDGMPRMLDGRGDFLPNAAQMALDYLSQDTSGFFLIVEGSQIDWGGHANDADYIITEVIDFDKTIGRALDFAEKNENTLVIVTADHETGGFTLSSDEGDYNKIKETFSTGGHSTTLIPVFAYGPGSESFSGIYQNNDIFQKMLDAVTW